MIGREAETALISSLVGGLRNGRPFVLTVRGEPGTGRSRLLAAARDIAGEAGVRPLTARGIDGPADPAFAGLYSLLRPFQSTLDKLAGDYAPAIRSALALGREQVEPLDVQLGALRALTTAAEADPLVLLLDDADRLDPASISALRFVLGRVGADPIGAIVATGPGPGPFDGVSTDVLPLSGLAVAALTTIVQQTMPCVDSVASTIATWADGSPLLAIELARSLTGAERDGTAPLPDAPGPTVLAVDRLQRELDELPEDVQRALVVVAADRTGRVSSVVGALAALGESAAALDRAEATGAVIVAGDVVRFRHALLRPLAYRLVAAASRRAAHRALAAALTERHHAGERAWHLVASCTGPDENVASTLDLLAGSERRRGAPSAAAATLEQAAHLSLTPAARTRRLTAAAVAHLDALDLAAAARTAIEAAEGGNEEAQLVLTEVIEHRDGPAMALISAPSRADVRADLHLATGDAGAARRALSEACDGTSVLAEMVAAALDPGSSLPREPARDTPLERRAHRRWLATAAARGVAPAAPSSIDELVAAAVAAQHGGRAVEALDFAARAANLIPPAFTSLADQIAAVVASVAAAAVPADEFTTMLSNAELRVAEAVASGLTNRQAADQLFLSAKTIDFHLQAIYRKLVINSRSELAARFATRGR